MSDNPATPEPTEPQSPPEPSAGTQNTGTPVEDNRIPYTRFKEVNEQNKALQKQLEELQAAERQRREAEMTELEKAQQRAADAAKRAEELTAQLEQERQQRLTDRRNNTVATALAQAQAIDADETVLWLQARKSEELQAAMSADGTPDPDQIKRLVDLAKAERPHHFRPGGVGSPSNRGGETPAMQLSEKHLAAALTQDEIEMAQQFGMTPEEYVKFKR